jgi:hypothetical protein
LYGVCGFNWLRAGAIKILIFILRNISGRGQGKLTVDVILY